MGRVNTAKGGTVTSCMCALVEDVLEAREVAEQQSETDKDYHLSGEHGSRYAVPLYS